MESPEDIYYKHICRLCLKYNKQDNMVPIFEDNSNKLSCYGKSVLFFADIVLKKEDDFPSKMCKKCLILLKNCIRFKFSCESSNQQLESLKNLGSGSFKQNVVEYTLFMSYCPTISTESNQGIPDKQDEPCENKENYLKINEIHCKNFCDITSDSEHIVQTNNNVVNDNLKYEEGNVTQKGMDKLYIKPKSDTKNLKSKQLRRRKNKIIRKTLSVANSKQARQSPKVQCKICDLYVNTAPEAFLLLRS
ncbi:unnamed protein product [Leptidea sinapis]|uniref:ZAD domain-containing protein n=1 Tax=Leptidea sinapis TaxID=189913 RepID=A0A5E4QCX7_9NEOP|nr:unnamed protein product [Leptidea sinapis]